MRISDWSSDVCSSDLQLLQPVGSEPSTHILKPDHPDPDYPHSAVNEWFVMRLARRMGLTVPDVSRRYVPEPLYLIERFDRSLGPAGVQRLHAIDACQLLNPDRQKSAASSVGKECERTCRSRG